MLGLDFFERIIMKKEEKIRYLIKNYFDKWTITRTTVEDELSEKQSMICVCGRLATGLHERNCKKFQNNVNGKTVKRLKHLIKKI